MTQRILLPLLLCSVLFVGCDSSTPDGGETEPLVLLPLDVGNEWVMAFTRYDEDGTLTESYTDTLRVVGDTTVAGERWAEIRCAQTPTGCIPGGFYSNREDGVWRWYGPGSDVAPYLLYKYPADVGDTYEQPSGFIDFNMTVRGTDAPVDTPAGTLLAYHYVLDADSVNGSPVPDEVGQLDRYLVPGQGFAFIDCSYITLRDEWVTLSEFGWELIAFEGD
jgi:hypothetical protein